MARQLVIATIYHHGPVSNADTLFLAQSEFNSFSKSVKMSYIGGNMPLRGWKRGGEGFKWLSNFWEVYMYTQKQVPTPIMPF